MHATFRLPRGMQLRPPSDGEMLLAAIVAAPHEMLPKLLFLDWAQENAEQVRQWIARAAARERLLTEQGIGYRAANGIRLQPSDRAFKKSRVSLRTAIKPFAACLAWLAPRGKRRTMHPLLVSYEWKHAVEAAFERDLSLYIPEGVFIGAAIHAGFGWERVPGSLSARHGISGRDPATSV
jgi:uncharacterized protein (TIGR02996 family)